MSDKPDQDVQAVAADILRYLRSHPDAADTAEGIARWWLGGRRYEDNLARVLEAMPALVAEGLVEKQTLPDGAEVYRAGRAKRSRSL
jgi:hypothetical protein